MAWQRTKFAQGRAGHWAAVVVLLAAAMPQAKATCYLMDANSQCAVCWKTTYSNAEDKTGVTTMAECPDGIQETWIKPLPETMYAMTEYKVAPPPTPHPTPHTPHPPPHAPHYAPPALRPAPSTLLWSSRTLPPWPRGRTAL